MVELDPKFEIWAFSAIFALFLSGKKVKFILYILNTFDVFNYFKFTRKKFSDGNPMLKKEYHLDRWNCDSKSYTFPKNTVSAV